MYVVRQKMNKQTKKAVNIFLIFSSVNERFSRRWSGLSGLYENVSSFCKTSTLHITKSKKKKKKMNKRTCACVGVCVTIMWEAFF